ncbi:MAG: hypothetical protein ACOZQL_43790 [Myxococcota bacterium]
MLRIALISVSMVVLAGCGMGGSPARGASSVQALTGTAEWLEFESPQFRLELFRDLARQSAAQAGSRGAVLFPMLVDGEFVAAPALEPTVDLLGAGDAGAPVDLVFEARGDRFADDRRDAFQGLSEREAAEVIARSLITLWNLKPTGPVTVVRVPGAPYAAAWIDGQLRLNPSFVYMASAPTR